MAKGNEVKAIVTLCGEDLLETRKLEAEELRAHNKVYEFKSTAETQLRTLQEAAATRATATMNHLQAMAKKYHLDIEQSGFDWDQMAFVQKKK